MARSADTRLHFDNQCWDGYEILTAREPGPSSGAPTSRPAMSARIGMRGGTQRKEGTEMNEPWEPGFPGYDAEVVP